MNKPTNMTVYIVDLESIPTRYTCEWKTHLPALIEKHEHKVVVISGPDDLPNNTTPGMFLNFSATNIYKSVQVEKFSRLFSEGKIKDGDYFLFTDAWHPGVLNLKYMADLLGVKIKIGGFWHSGSYDPQDGLGRLIGDRLWVRNTEKAMFCAFDYNYFATDFHIEMFCKNLFDCTVKDVKEFNPNRIIRTGWPMEYMQDALVSHKGLKKRDLILFPHRIAPEKQVEIFRDLATHLPQYEFLVCQDQQLTKNEYHNLLGEAKIVFSANLQETLGISTCCEGPLARAIPLAPNRLSYSEIFNKYPDFLYPSEWTIDWNSYLKHQTLLVDKIVKTMNNYDNLVSQIDQYVKNTYSLYFNANNLLENL